MNILLVSLIPFIAAVCDTRNIDRLKKGPANIPEVIADGVQWRDADFSFLDTLYWTGVTDSAIISNFNTQLANKNYFFRRFNVFLPNAGFFGVTGEPIFSDVR